MIIIISAQEPNLEGAINERFGRCPFLIKIDTSNNQWEPFQNPGISQSGGAGVAAAQFVIDQKVNAVISGDFGPHAANALRASAIEMRLFSDNISTVQQALDAYKQESLLAFGQD